MPCTILSTITMSSSDNNPFSKASHARYFENFLKFVEYGESMPEIMKNQVIHMVMSMYPHNSKKTVTNCTNSKKRPKRVKSVKSRSVLKPIWSSKPQPRLSRDTPEAELRMKLGSTSIKGLLADFGDSIHLGKINGKYVLMIESNTIEFDKGVSPIEFHGPDELQVLIEKIKNKS
ncbi:DUF3898 domain-containing protein [Peribacillus sp. JNUCC41]|uniref:DUF3898 domain-containing protein n=1 Tax=Peribacillus sp. JNUCC41 TaxID=2778370 RepID=UPI0025707DDD|nr:DUF3898 domain-containing protein [Brevibacillus sp. JNUCC-41]